MPQNDDPVLDLHEIQGDVLIGLQKNFQNFIFFRILDVPAFKAAMRGKVISQITTTLQAHERDLINQQRKKLGEKVIEPWLGLNVSFTKVGLTALLGDGRPQIIVQKNGQNDDRFELGAADGTVIDALNDPSPTTWKSTFTSDTIDGVFFVTGPDEKFVKDATRDLRTDLGGSVTAIHTEMGRVRPEAQRGHEHFGFLDGVSQPGIRGLTKRSNPKLEPNQGLPGQDLIWPGEFVFGYPGQHPTNPVERGPVPAAPNVPWLSNGSLMVFRRLVQLVPEFNTFVRGQADTLGMLPEQLASRMVGRWRSGAPLLLAPLQDNIALGKDPALNNDFEYASDPTQLACPYAAHIRMTNPRDDPSQNKAGVQTHRIIRAGIPFGPEVGQDEATVTVRPRGLMFVCYQTSIEQQFEFIQSTWANNIDFVGGKTRPPGRGRGAVTPHFDPIIGQASAGEPRSMDEPVSNYPAGDTTSTLVMPNPWVVLTAAAYFFVPSITALREVLMT